eukprot:scaffold303691_cov39-Prasinocladus_malaysianus.AAC.2
MEWRPEDGLLNCTHFLVQKKPDREAQDRLMQTNETAMVATTTVRVRVAGARHDVLQKPIRTGTPHCGVTQYRRIHESRPLSQELVE